jgi:hypothetical protein
VARVKWPVEKPRKHPNKPRKPRHPKEGPAPRSDHDPTPDDPLCGCGHVQSVHTGGLCHGFDGPFSSGCWCQAFQAREPGPASGGD